MEMLPITTLEISAVLYEEDGLWISQGLEFDITARGSSRAEASTNFVMKVAEELVMSAELGDKAPLAGVGPAPQEYWQMFQAARESIEPERSPMRILDDTHLPRIRPYMRIGQRVAA